MATVDYSEAYNNLDRHTVKPGINHTPGKFSFDLK